MKNATGKQRRTDHDRRQNHIPFYKLFLFKGKRRSFRRNDDYRKITVLDHYQPSIIFSVFVVLALSLVDAALTLALLEKGAVELNPVMRYYISLGPETFIMVKYGITALALLIAVVLNSIISTRYHIASLILPFSGLMFASVIIWELYLLSR